MKKIAAVGVGAYLLALLIFFVAYFEYRFSEDFSWLPPSPFAGFFDVWGAPIYLTGMILILGPTLFLSRKENIQNYDPKDRRVRTSAVQAGLIGAGLLVATFLFVINFDSIIPVILHIAISFVLLFTAIHFLFRAILTPFGLYPWRFLPRKLLVRDGV